MKVDIYSRKAMESFIKSSFSDNIAVISFSDPLDKRTPKDYAPLDYKGKCENLFRIAVHDIDIEIPDDYNLTFDTYFPEADELAKFITSSARKGLDIIYQCEYGQSRSAACVASIKEFYDHSGITVFADYRYYPNQLIFNKVLNALKKHEDEIKLE